MREGREPGEGRKQGERGQRGGGRGGALEPSKKNKKISLQKQDYAEQGVGYEGGGEREERGGGGGSGGSGGVGGERRGGHALELSNSSLQKKDCARAPACVPPRPPHPPHPPTLTPHYPRPRAPPLTPHLSETRGKAGSREWGREGRGAKLEDSTGMVLG